jgi:hypothetical protein
MEIEGESLKIDAARSETATHVAARGHTTRVAAIEMDANAASLQATLKASASREALRAIIDCGALLCALALPFFVDIPQRLDDSTAASPDTCLYTVTPPPKLSNHISASK